MRAQIPAACVGAFADSEFAAVEGQLHKQASDIAHVIQLSVAPVFLLAAISGLLGVLTNRLHRIIDRARKIEEELLELQTGDKEREERLKVFSRRARLCNHSISLCTACSSMVCLVIIALFAGVSMDYDLSWLVSALFVAAMVSLFSALVCFLWEVRLATRSLRIGATTREGKT